MEERSSLKRKLLRLIGLCTACIALFCLIYIPAHAEWDGVGGTNSNSGSLATGSYCVWETSYSNITAYRFSIYDASGAKLGNSIDIHNTNWNIYSPNWSNKPSTWYRSTGANKKSHIEYLREYQDGGTTSIDGYGTTSSSAYEIVNSTIPQNPSELGSWVSQNAQYIARQCAVFTYNQTNTYIVCEPLQAAMLEFRWHALTMAEYAVYQSTQYGWNAYPTNQATNTYGYIARGLSGYMGHWLYATETYPSLGTKPILPSMIKTDALGDTSILIGSNNRFNTAADILNHQVGMGIYTNIIPTYSLIVDTALDGSLTSNVGTFDIYINDELVADDVSEYNKNHLSGATYRIEDIKPAEGRSFDEEATGPLTGALVDSEELTLHFTTNQYTLDITGLLDEQVIESIEGYGSFDLYINDTLVSENAVKHHAKYPYGTTYEIKRIQSTEGYDYTGESSYSGTITSDTEIPLSFSTLKYELNINTTLSGAQSSNAGVFDIYINDVLDAAGVTEYSKEHPYGTQYTIKNITANPGKSYVGNEQILLSGTLTGQVDTSLPFITYAYVVKFDGNNASSGNMADVLVNIGESIVLPKNSYLKTGHTFICWSTKADGTGTNYNSDSSFVPTSDITLYAQWEPSEYILTIDMNGGYWTFNGTEYTSPQSFTIAAGDSITIEAPHRPGYTFSGWVISNNTCSLTAGKYLHGTGNCNIVAVWSEHKYPVTEFNGYTRFIKHEYLDTLEPNSIWRQETLYSILENALKNDLSNTSGSQQIWHFSEEDYETVHEWCLDHNKGEQTNRSFLMKFMVNNRLQ